MTLVKETNLRKATAPPSALVAHALVPLFAATLFVSAGLMFWIQPLFAKMALPFLGGAPAVWNTAMMFFQATLLAGYGYVHFVNLKLSPRRQAVIHIAVVAIALVSLPIAVRGGYNPDQDPTLGLIALLGISIGLPFFAVSATAPMLQRWFALSDHRDAGDPYFLYGASNLGSILALLAFPFFLEPTLSLREQGVAWTGGFVVLLFLIGLCALIPAGKAVSRTKAQSRAQTTPDARGQIWRQRLLWTALAFAPSSLLLGVTQHITTDIAAVPLLWVIPLATYLLTFVIVFARRPILPHPWVIRLQPYLLVVALLGSLFQGIGIWYSVAVHLAVFFLLALSCHGELVKRRPEVGRLTEFYLCMSLGGFLGGAFNVLAAPVLFDGVYEYGLAVVVAATLRPGAWSGSLRNHLLDLVLPLALLGLALAIYHFDLPPGSEDLNPFARLAFIGIIGILVFGFRKRPFRYGLGVGAALLVYASMIPNGDVLTQSRSFFGVYRVKLTSDGLARQLFHGTTVHGAQMLAKDFALEPVAYYSRQGPLGQVFEAFRKGRPDLHVGLVGLGVGSTLCYARPDDRWTLFEIDPMVAEIARNDSFFSFMRDCDKSESAELLLGDARLRLQGLPDASLDLMVLDAYNSDAIPIHLMTREALALYRAKLTPGGVLMFHVSNRWLNLPQILSALVSEAQMAALFQIHNPDETSPKHAYTSYWVAVALRAADLSMLQDSGDWQELPAVDRRPWTDDYSNIIDVIR
jgi:spermidine synthase